MAPRQKLVKMKLGQQRNVFSLSKGKVKLC